MSYNLGQLRITADLDNEDNEYERKYSLEAESSTLGENKYKIGLEETEIQIIEESESNLKLENFYIQMNPLNNNASYYLSIGIQNKDKDDLNFTLKLKKIENDIVVAEQEIEECSVPQAVSKEDQEIKYFEFVISPNAEYNRVVFVLHRTIDDYSGKRWKEENLLEKFKIIKISELKNLIQSNDSIKYITKIGIQGLPSSLTCINREPIRLGRNGIYEINSGLKIDSVSVLPKDEMDYFIIDYEYEKEVS